MPSFSSRKLMVSRCMSEPCRLGKKQQSAAIRSRNLRPTSLTTTQSTVNILSNKNEEWDCSNMTQEHDSRKAVFSRLSSVINSRTHHTSKEKRAEDKLSAGTLRKSLSSRCVSPTPIAGDPPALADEASNKKNEEWHETKITQIKSSIKFTYRTHTKKKRNLSFAETNGCVCHHTSSSDDMNTAWYNESDHNQFSNDATARARITNRMMEYATLNESTYNSSTGLTSPQVLKEYLSSPEEIIGIERLLTAQKTVRMSLKIHHAKALLKEQRRQKREGYDPLLLAERLRSSSTIAAHLAKERASYIVLMD